MNQIEQPHIRAYDEDAEKGRRHSNMIASKTQKQVSHTIESATERVT